MEAGRMDSVHLDAQLHGKKHTRGKCCTFTHYTAKSQCTASKKLGGTALCNSSSCQLLSVAVSMPILWQGETVPLFTSCDEIFTENSVLSHPAKADLLLCADQHQIVKSWTQPPTEARYHWGKELSKATDHPSPSN